MPTDKASVHQAAAAKLKGRETTTSREQTPEPSRTKALHTEAALLT